MVMNASSTSLGNWKSSSRTSTSTTAAPNEPSAFDTPRPVASETSRSEPGPPIKTAIFFGKFVMPRFRDGECFSFRFSHDFHFGLQFDSALFPRRCLDHFDQLEHLCRGRAAIVYNEIAVDFRHARLSDA